VTKRFSQGVTGQFGYTFSKNLGDSGVRDPRNLALSKGLLNTDRTHIITSNATYDLPFGQNKLLFSGAPGWVDRIINGWQVSSIATWTSGAPLAWTSGTNGGLYNSASLTADLVGKMPKGDIVKCGVAITAQCPSGVPYVSYWNNLRTPKAPLPDFGGDANLAARFTNQVVADANGNTIIQNAQPGSLGNMPQYLPGIKGPGFLSFNMAATKSVKITESSSFTLRADAVNILNKPQWLAPTTNLNFNGSTFGRLCTSSTNCALGARTLTLNARVDF
jgi:hypothetical protein